MHAIRQYEFGAPEVLRFEEAADLAPAAGEVRIGVEASGVHLLDTTIRRGDEVGSMPPPTLPMTPGREVAGVVDQVGEGVDVDWLGRRVVGHLGPASGGYADQAVARADRIHEVPGSLTLADAVAAIGTGRTAVGILDLAPVRPVDVVLIPSAAGGLGSALVQHARRSGAFVIGLAGGPAKADLVRSIGVDVAIDYLEPDWQDAVQSALGTRTPTMVFDGVAGEVGRVLYRMLGAGGRLVQFGWTASEPVDYDDPGRPVISVLGPAMLAWPGGIGSLEAESLAKSADGTVRVVVGSTFPLDQAAEAHRALESRETFGKVVLVSAAS